MPPGNPQAYFQPPTPQPQQFAGGLSPDILKLLQQVLASTPDQPAGGPPMKMPTGGVPQMARQQHPQEQVMKMLVGLMQAPQGQNMNSGAMGVKGRMFGSMGGRPRGS